jgi:ADP-ribose pyrophosphatase YjhB (NUDIX family)
VGGRNPVEGSSVTRIDHVNDPDAPAANRLVPGASAVVVDQAGRILLHRRHDNELWSIPGGGMEVGERIADTVVREVREETGLEVEPESLVGIYSDPTMSSSTATARFASSSRSASPAAWSGESWPRATSRLRSDSSPRPRSRPCPCTSRSGCASATTWSTDLNQSLLD